MWKSSATATSESVVPKGIRSYSHRDRKLKPEIIPTVFLLRVIDLRQSSRHALQKTIGDSPTSSVVVGFVDSREPRRLQVGAVTLAGESAPRISRSRVIGARNTDRNRVIIALIAPVHFWDNDTRRITNAKSQPRKGLRSAQFPLRCGRHPTLVTLETQAMGEPARRGR